MPDLDELLARGAPPTAVPGSVREDTLRLLGEASRRRRRMWRPWIVAGTTLALAGGGVAAAAQFDLLGRLPWAADYRGAFTASTGVRCENAERIVAPDGVADDAPHLVALRTALAGIDPSRIDLTDELARLKYKYEVVGVPYEFRDQEGNLVSKGISRDPRRQADYEAEALSNLLIQEAKQRVAAEGFAAELVDPGFRVDGVIMCEDAS